jgi:hypothetical protein
MVSLRAERSKLVVKNIKYCEFAASQESLLAMTVQDYFIKRLDRNFASREGPMKRSISAVSMVMIFAAAALVMLSPAVPAFAQQTNPCANDFKQYCGSVTPGGGRLVQCYEQNKNQMSGDCIGWMEGVKANAAPVQKACADMINSRCADVKGDPPAMLNCLQGNYIDLTVDCRNQLNQFKGMYPMPMQ